MKPDSIWPFHYRTSPYVLDVEQPLLKDFVERVWGITATRATSTHLKDAAWKGMGISGEDHAVFIMYYAINATKAHHFHVNGFEATTNFHYVKYILGEGIYVSRYIEIARTYGNLVLRVLVSPGKIHFGKSEDWHSEYDSAWHFQVISFSLA